VEDIDKRGLVVRDVYFPYPVGPVCSQLTLLLGMQITVKLHLIKGFQITKRLSSRT